MLRQVVVEVAFAAEPDDQVAGVESLQSLVCLPLVPVILISLIWESLSVILQDFK
jgi:hypothetical protein